jgi:hypothetical protein
VTQVAAGATATIEAESGVLPRLAPAWRTTTFRQCAKGLAWTLGLTGLFALWYAVEKWGLRLPNENRLVRSPALVPMTILGIPHFLIGFLFLATSRRLRVPGAAWRLAGLAVLSVALCALYAWGGGHYAKSKIPTAAVALYFIVHELRDEAFFFRAYGDAPADVDAARTSRFLAAVTTVLIVALAGIGTFAYDVYSRHRGRAGVLDYVLPDDTGNAARAVLVLGIAALLAVVAWRAWARREADRVATWVSRSRPMFAVYGLFLLVVLSGLASGTLLEAIVLWHVLEWLFFSVRQIGEREGKAPRPPGFLAWVKGTRRGFLVLHLGLAALVFVGLAAWAYVYGKSGWLTPVVGPEAFYYWTIAHVTMSFVPR